MLIRRDFLKAAGAAVVGMLMPWRKAKAASVVIGGQSEPDGWTWHLEESLPPTHLLRQKAVGTHRGLRLKAPPFPETILPLRKGHARLRLDVTHTTWQVDGSILQRMVIDTVDAPTHLRAEVGKHFNVLVATPDGDYVYLGKAKV